MPDTKWGHNNVWKDYNLNAIEQSVLFVYSFDLLDLQLQEAPSHERV